MSDTESANFGRAIGDATRQEIMHFCCCEWRSVNEVADKVSVSQPTISHHLAILREAGLVLSRKEGKQVFYKINQPKVVSCCGKLLFTFAPEEKATKTMRGCCG